jgi:exopolyphosphatase/guanosine-5'-triphosphate,3'-diphosphate pyrophosphatase
LPAPLHFAAIDAGSNAIRLMIARVFSPHHFKVLHAERVPVRLGHNVFTRRRLDDDTLERGVEAFGKFRSLMDHYRVHAFRAVATSAAREARNRRLLIERIRREARIALEVIDTQEEARLVRSAVFGSLGRELSPRLIVDIGGGSLEVNLLRQGAVEASVGLPLGTVRLLETYDLRGSVSEDDARRLRAHILAVLQSCLPARLDLEGQITVACGGNAEALAEIAPGPQVRGLNTLNLRLLRERLWEILSMDEDRRRKVFKLRENRADVIAVAAVVFCTLARWCNISRMLVPGVGVRDGILRDLMQQHFGNAAEEFFAPEDRALLESVDEFARRFGDDHEHSLQVRRLALSLFDQLRHIHGMDHEERLLLDVAARLHDIGRAVNEEGHHKHGEYLVRHARIPGLGDLARAVVACVVRFHNKRSRPGMDHKLYASLDPGRRTQVRVLAAILRLAEGLDRDHKRNVLRVDVETTRRQAFFRVHVRAPSNVPVWGAQRRAALFEEEFGMRAAFSRSLAESMVA